MSPGSVRDLVFVSYSHDDREWRDRLLLLLKPFVRQSQLQVWADPYIRSGDVWRREIDAALARSRVGVVLLTPALLASDFIAEIELPNLLRAARAGELTLLVVPVGHCVEGSTRFPDGDLTEFQWPWDAADPLELLSQGKRNHALVTVTNAIVRATIDGSGRSFTVMPQATRSATPPVSTVAAPGAVHGVPPFPPNYILRHEAHDELKRAVLGSFAVVGLSAGDSRIGLHGQGGIGKTVVAMGVACDEEVRRAFPDGVYWITLGQQPRLESLQSLLASYFGDRQPIDDIGAGIRLLRERLQGKACLLVLDDVWQLVHAKAFDVLDSRSRLLVTTRDSSVLTALGARHLRVDALPTEVALELMARWAGLDPSALPAVARDVVEEVECLPLGLSLAGAQVRDGRRWEDLLSALREGDLIYLDHPYGSVLKSMQASVDALGKGDAARYLDLAIFPEDAEIPSEVIEALWAATGKVDARGTRALLTRFASRNLLRLSRVDTRLEEPDVDGAEHATRRLQHVVSLHDLQRDFTRLMVDDLPALHARLIDTFRATLRPPASATVQPGERWASLPEDADYQWQFLAYHLVGAGYEQELERLLTNADWLYARLTRFSSLALTADFQFSLADSGLRALRDAIVLSAHVLAKDPDALMSQLAGRLRSNRDPRIQALIDSTPAPLRGSARLHPLVGRLAPPGGPLLQTFEGHSDRVWAVTLLPDGQHALSGSVDGTLKLWDLASGAVLQTFVGHADAVTAVTVLADGRRAVSGSADRTLKLWDLASGAALQTFEGHAGAVRSVTELPDSKRILSGSADRTLKVWDLESGTLLQTLEGHTNWINGAAALPDGRHVVSASDDGTLQLWDVDTGMAVQTLGGHSGGVNAVTVLADGQRVLSGGDDGTVKLWELATGAVSRSFEGHADWVRAVTVLPDGQRALSGSDDRTLKLWDLATDAVVPSFECHTDWVRGVAVLPDGSRALSASYDGTLKLWSLANGSVIKTFEGHTDGVTAVALLPGGERALSGSDDGTVKLWDLASGAVLTTFTGHTGAVLAVAVMPDGHRALSGSYDRTLKMWDLESGQLLQTFVGHTRAINAVTPLPTGNRALSGGADRALTVWNLDDGSVLQTFHGHERRVWAVAVLPDGERALSGGDQTLKLWDLATGALLHTFAGHSDRIWDVAVLPDGQLAVSASDDNTLKLWNLETGVVLATFYGDAPYHCVSAASHDAIVAGDALGRIHILSITGQPAADAQKARAGA